MCESAASDELEALNFKNILAWKEFLVSTAVQTVSTLPLKLDEPHSRMHVLTMATYVLGAQFTKVAKILLTPLCLRFFQTFLVFLPHLLATLLNLVLYIHEHKR